MVTVWRRPAVGLADNLILLGGHSLLAAQLTVRIADQFGVELSLRSVFEHPTVAGIAVEIRRVQAASAEMPVSRAGLPPTDLAAVH